MLRTVETRHNNPRVFYGRATTSGGNTVTSVIGKDDLATATEVSAGLPVLTIKQPFSRTPVVVAAPSDSVANGGYCELAAASTASVISPKILDAAGSGTDGSFDYAIFGYNSSDINRCMRQEVLCTKRRSRIIGGRIASDGSVSIGISDFSVNKTGTGVYVVTFKRAFSATPVVLPIGISSVSIRNPKVTAKTALSCTVTIYNAAGAAQDGDFYITVLGADTKEEHGGAFDPILNSQRKPRMVVGQITYTAGVPAATINSNDFSSITDNGTGDATINLVTPFRRECIVMATARAGRAHIHTGSASAPRIIVRDAAGSPVDPTTVDFIIVGSFDASEY